MRKIIFLFLFSFHAGFAQELKDTTARPFAVVELFTSEGCRSCPPAEKLLSKIVTDARKKQERVFALEFHVDYWNKYGWKDPYSSLQFTRRQKRYIDIASDREMYTPQMLVNGKEPFVGSEEQTANVKIKEAFSKEPPLYLTVSKSNLSTADTLLLAYETGKTNSNYFLNVAVVERGIVMKIGKGENSGKTLQHDNVVRYFTSAELNSKSGIVKIPVGKLNVGKNFSLIAFIQHKQTYHILAADGFDF